LQLARIKKSADLQTRFFNFVKYTKTLSLRNRHDTESRAFFSAYCDPPHLPALNLLLHILTCLPLRALHRAGKHAEKTPTEFSNFKARLIPSGFLCIDPVPDRIPFAAACCSGSAAAAASRKHCTPFSNSSRL